MSQWQPIETFDKSKPFLSYKNILLGHSKKKWIRFGKYYKEMGRWYYSATNEISQYAQVDGDEPTHWMEIPEISKE